MQRSLPAPILLAVVLVLDAYSGVSMHLSMLGRPLLAVVLAGMLVTSVAWLVTRHGLLASAVGCLALLLLFGQYQVAAVGIGVGALITWRWRDAPVTVLVVPVAILLVIAGWRLWDWWVVAPQDFRVSGFAAVAPQDRPDVFVLLLDGYARADSLAELGINNEPFLAELELLGFFVDRESSSPYLHTEMALAGSMGTANLPAHPESDDFGDTLSHRHLYRRTYLINTPTMDAFRDLGYRLTYIPSPIMHTDWRGWDERRDVGILTDFETLLIQRSPARYVLGGWVLEQQRATIDASLEAWSKQGGLTFAHVMAPHPPFVWEDEPPACWYAAQCNLWESGAAELGLTEEEYAGLLATQIERVNAALLHAVRRVIAEHPDAMVVLFSDHGARYSEDVSDEWHRNLFASRTPGLRFTPGVQGLFVRLLEAVRPNGAD
jgi:hypothetical protein